MHPLRLLGAMMLSLPWVSLHLAVEGIGLRTFARRSAGAGEHPWGGRVEGIGPAWLTALLREGLALGPELDVERLDLHRVGHDGQLSAIYRLTPTYAGTTSGPASLILKTTAPRVKDRLLNRLFDLFANEISAYELPTPALGLLRPRCWYGHRHPTTGASLLLLEDLGGWRFEGHNRTLNAEDARTLVRALAEHQAHWWQHPSFAESPFRTTSEAFEEFLTPLVKIAWRRGRRSLASLVDRGTFDLFERFVGDQGAILRRMAAAPPTLVHGDLNINNVFFDDERSRVTAIDWAGARIGSWAEDLAHIVVMNLGPHLGANLEEELLAEHRRVLAERGTVLHHEEQRRGYALGLFQTCAILVIATIILDEKRNPALFASYQDTLQSWAAAARRHHLAELLAEALQ